MTIKKYTFQITVQPGIIRVITTTAASEKQARKQIANAEGCPERIVTRYNVRAAIKAQKAYGNNNDTIYRNLAGTLGMFGVAFFGHKGLKGDKATLSRVWGMILSI